MSRQIKRLPSLVRRWQTAQVEIKRPTATVGTYGEQLNDFVTSSVVRGRVIGLRELKYGDFAGQEGNTTTYRVSLEADADVRAGDRLLVEGVEYDVVGVDTHLTGQPDKQVRVAVRNG